MFKNKNLYLLIPALLLTGCDNGSQVSENNSDSEQEIIPEFDTTKEVTITFYHTMNKNLMEVLDDAILEFNETYPNIHVNSFSAGGYDDVCDQLATSISAGATVCDMAYCYPDHVAKYNRAKSVISLDGYINDSRYGYTAEQIADFNQAYYDEGKSFGDGLMYCVPFSKSTEVMYYNEDVFDELDLEVPDHWFPVEGKTDETDTTSLEYCMKKIKAAYPQDTPLGYDSESNWFITLAAQYGYGYTSNGSNHYLFNNEGNQQLVTKLNEWYDKGYFTTKQILEKYTSSAFVNTEDEGSKCYICIGSSAGATNQKPEEGSFNVQVAPVPQKDPVSGDTDTRSGKVISQGPDICIFKNTDKQKQLACWLLTKFLTTNVTFQCEFSLQSGYMPVFNSAYKNKTYSDFLSKSSMGNDYIVAKSIETSRLESDWFFTSPAFIGSTEARTQVGNMMVSILTKQKSVSEGFAEAIRELNK